MTVSVEERRAQCNAYYALNREQIQAARKAKRLRARAAQLEQAVLLELPIGHTDPACGTRFATTWHRLRQESCTQCAFVLAADKLARESRRSAASARRAAWAAANPEKMREYRRANYERVGREAWNARGAAWRAANLERARELVQVRKRADRTVGANDRALRRAREHRLPSEQVDRGAVWSRDRGICHLCESPADPSDWHLDHVVPIARGGAHVYDNVRVSHPACNQRKGARVPSRS